MADVNAPNDDSAVPPYDDRSAGNAEARAGVGRAMGSAAPLRDPNEPAAPDDDTAGTEPPDGVGVSTTRRGEDVSKSHHEGQEAGRHDTGTSADPARRPTGESTDRDQTGVDAN